MIPVVVRSCEELLRLVPNELREAAYALGVPKWLTIVRVVMPTAISGIISGVILAIARVIGETAPLLIAAGFTASLNNNLFANPMMTLPVFVYDSYAHPGVDIAALPGSGLGRRAHPDPDRDAAEPDRPADRPPLRPQDRTLKEKPTCPSGSRSPT